MSKFLKFIVHFIVICTIICVVGLAASAFPWSYDGDYG